MSLKKLGINSKRWPFYGSHWVLVKTAYPPVEIQIIHEYNMLIGQDTHCLLSMLIKLSLLIQMMRPKGKAIRFSVKRRYSGHV